MNRWAAVARFGGVGDNLMAASPFPILKRLGYMTEMITGEPNHVVFNNNPWIDKLSVKKTERDLPQNDMLGWQKWFDSRAHEYDIFAHLSHACEGRHALFETMTSFWWSPEYRRKLCAGSYLETVHDICGVPYEFDKLFYPTPEETERALETKKKIGGKFVCWIISGSRIDKVYPYCSMIICRILKELKMPVVMLGAGPKEFSMGKAIMEHVELQNSTTEGLHLGLSPEGVERGGVNDWPIRRSLTMAINSDMVVSPDTGPAWGVAFEEVPKVIMVSHASVENITKHWHNTKTLHADPQRVSCWPCHRLHNTPDTCVPNKENNGASCISDISVETMFETIKAGLEVNKNIIHAEDVFSRSAP